MIARKAARAEGVLRLSGRATQSGIALSGKTTEEDGPS